MDEDTRRRIKERHANIAATLIRASTDSALRQQLMEEPAALFGPVDQPRPLLPDHVVDMRRDIITHLIDKAASDAEFPEQLRQDLFKAIRSAGLMPRMERIRSELPINEEVTAYGWGWGNPWGWKFW